jgi:hypothetical protein
MMSKNRLASVVQALTFAESQIILLARCYPANWLELHAGLAEKWKAGRCEEPEFHFARAQDFSELRSALAEIEKWAQAQGPWGALWAARVRELDLEAQMAEHVGDCQIRALAQQRFSVREDTNSEALRRLARCWALLETGDSTSEVVRSDDESNSRSLLRQMRLELEKHSFSMPVKLDARLASHAAVDDRFVWLKPQVYLRPLESKRIVLHEVHGHVVRRFAACRPENAGYKCGVAGADADEEGRALWLENDAALLDSERKMELGRRHLAADACQQGASFCDAVRLLIDLRCTVAQAIKIALRVWRGGGIAREIIYLDAYFRAKKVLGKSAQLDDWMKRGRLSFDVARRLARGLLQPLA